MDTSVVLRSIRTFAARHRSTLEAIPKRQSGLLELGAFVGIQEHYRSSGFSVRIQNPRPGGPLKVKTSTKGHPWNYTRVLVSSATASAELHMNLLVAGAHDDGAYCVDVAITSAGAVPSRASRSPWRELANRDLLSFAEAKSLRVYPMLLAQFVGIVHEVKPNFLRGPIAAGFGRQGNLPPTLIALGPFSANADAIVRAYPRRNFCIHVAENYDGRLAAYRARKCSSPLFWNHEA